MSEDKIKNEIREIDALVEIIRANPFPEAIEDARAAIDSLGTPVAEDISVEDIDADGVPCQMFTADGVDENRVILYLHGGGYAFGSFTSYGGLASEIGRAANCRVLLVDYRLAPEHTFPAPIDDCCTAYQWLLDNGYESQKISFAGDSAGGSLVLSTMLASREKGSPLPGSAVCISPWLDMEFKGASIKDRKEIDPMLTEEGLSALASLYMGEQELSGPLASPLNADISDLPPLFIQVGESEILLSDAERLADKAKAANLKVTLETWPDMIHVWHLFYPMLTEGRTAIAGIGDFIRENSGS
jgi:epsilon-lactone hydrolase